MARQSAAVIPIRQAVEEDPLEEFRRLVDEAGGESKETRSGYMARCVMPGHDDTTPSMSFGPGRSVPVVAKCHGCGAGFPEIAAHVGFSSETEYEYEYEDEAGNLVRQIVKTVRDGKKDFRPWAQRPDGTWHPAEWPEAERIPYRLPALRRAAAQGGTVYLTEGEKDADRVTEMGLVATAVPFGANGWRDTYARHFAGVGRVVILPDHDKPGEVFAQAVAHGLRGMVPSVRIVRWPGSTPGGLWDGYDVSDWADKTGGTNAELAEALEALAEAAMERVITVTDAAGLLDEVTAFLRRFMAFTNEHQAPVVALWALHTHAVAAADTTPRLVIRSPEKQSGKTRVQEVLEELVANKRHTVSITAPALFRIIEKGTAQGTPPTLLVDEFDTIFKTKTPTESQEALRAILNGGYRRGAVATRVVGQGAKMDVQDFQTFAPVCLAGIGRLPDTIEDRSIIITLRRRKRTEEVQRWRMAAGAKAAEPLRHRLEAWAADHIETLRAGVDPERIPEELSDRAQDIWEPLLAIADAAGGEWPRRAREAAIELAKTTEADEPPLKVRLLADTRRIYTSGDGHDWLSTSALVKALVALDEAPWADLGNGREVTEHQVGKWLSGYDIPSTQVRVPGQSRRTRGRARQAFQEAWEVYLPPMEDDDHLDSLPGHPEPY